MVSESLVEQPDSVTARLSVEFDTTLVRKYRKATFNVYHLEDMMLPPTALRSEVSRGVDTDAVAKLREPGPQQPTVTRWWRPACDIYAPCGTSNANYSVYIVAS